uniref:Uncharacterized protein n=1 Tax=Salix viminalis TaxID=40686 RepID=A0A6N2LKK3_SALVM
MGDDRRSLDGNADVRSSSLSMERTCSCTEKRWRVTHSCLLSYAPSWFEPTAIKKYLQGIESSTPDEVKQLEEIIADKDRELEQKERELELFRASLTASTPQQGNDSLPRSLPAQTDNQGTGQSPLKNNEISLCMDEK